MAIEPLVVELTPPPDPWEVARKFAAAQGFIFFDSAGGPKELTRYSYLSFSPFRFFQWRGGDPFVGLKHAIEPYRASHIAGLPPFQGGAAGLFCYDLCQTLERIPPHRRYILDDLMPKSTDEEFDDE